MHSTSLTVHLRSWFHLFRYYFTKRGVKANQKFKNKYANERCFIVCTGKSVQEFDFSLIQSEWVLSCNKFFCHPDANKLKYAGYFDMDPVSSHTCNPDPYWSKGGYHRELADFANSIGCHVFQRLGLKKFCQKNGAFFADATYLQTAGLLAVSRDIHTDLGGRMNVLDGVVFTMLGAAHYLGFKEIYLLGCDYTLQPRQIGHFYDSTLIQEVAPLDDRHVRLNEFLSRNGVTVTNLIQKGFESPIYKWKLMADFMNELR